jgi:glutamine amidotransferase
MRGPSVGVVDLGVGNILSVSNALEHVGAHVFLVDQAAKGHSVDRLVLPGVGSFRHTMDLLVRSGLNEYVLATASVGTPVLGICLGMQILMTDGHEDGETLGLGLIDGSVVHIPTVATDGQAIRVPHIGWRPLVATGSVSQPGRDVIDADATFYFAHSFAAEPLDPNAVTHTVARGGHQVCAVVMRDNVIGVQFHPEKSGPAGLEFLKQFIQTQL